MAAAENYAPIQVIQNPSQDVQPVTAVISQRIKRSNEADYEHWMQGISAVARQFPGHLGTTIIRPDAGICIEYVIILKFDCYANLKNWLHSDERKQWLEKSKPLVAKTSPVQILTGLETWFTLPHRAQQPPPPRYKMVMLTTFAVFSIVNLLNPVLMPILSSLPNLLGALISTLISVAILTYGVMPRLTKLFYRWLYPV